MAKAKLPTRQVVTPEGSCMGINLAKPYQNPEYPKAEPKYSISLVLDKAGARELMTSIQAVAREAWPDMDDKMRITFENGDTKTIGLPFKTGEQINEKRRLAGKDAYDFLPEKLVFRAASSSQPACQSIKGLAIGPETINGGDTVRLAIGVAAVHIPGSFTGITLYLNGVLLVKKSESRFNAAEAFKAYIPNESAVDPFADVTDYLS